MKWSDPSHPLKQRLEGESLAELELLMHLHIQVSMRLETQPFSSMQTLSPLENILFSNTD